MLIAKYILYTSLTMKHSHTIFLYSYYCPLTNLKLGDIITWQKLLWILNILAYGNTCKQWIYIDEFGCGLHQIYKIIYIPPVIINV